MLFFRLPSSARLVILPESEVQSLEEPRKPPTLQQAKEKLIRSMAAASPATPIKEHPLLAIAIAAGCGAILGVSGRARKSVVTTADMVLSLLLGATKLISFTNEK
jgi:hypothetical protein